MPKTTKVPNISTFVTEYTFMMNTKKAHETVVAVYDMNSDTLSLDKIEDGYMPDRRKLCFRMFGVVESAEVMAVAKVLLAEVPKAPKMNTMEVGYINMLTEKAIG